MARHGQPGLVVAGIAVGLVGCSAASTAPTATQPPTVAVTPAATTVPSTVADAARSAAKPAAAPTAKSPSAKPPTPKLATTFKPPSPHRVDLFQPPDEKLARRTAPSKDAGSGVVLRGFIEVDEPQVVLSIGQALATLRAGQRQNDLQVVAIQPPQVTLQQGALRWTEVLYKNTSDATESAPE